MAFFHQDPLEALYPEAFAYGVELEACCRSAGTPLLVSPGALGRTMKSRQLSALAAAGVTVARVRRLGH